MSRKQVLENALGDPLETWKNLAITYCKEKDALRAKLDEAKKLIADHLWICECRCDVAYTSRKMHEPNALCGEMDDMKEWLATQVRTEGEK